MVDKKRFILVLFLLFALVLIEDSFADSCCINLEEDALTCGAVTESACSISSQYEYYDISCSQVDKCAEKCFTCVNAEYDGVNNVAYQNVWNPIVLGCNNDLWVSVPSSSNSLTDEISCLGATNAPTSTAALTVSGKVKDNGVDVSGAIVTCSLSTAVTTATGDYSLPSCKSGPETIRATLGAKSGIITTTLPPSKTGVNIALISATTAALTVNVKNSAGTGLSATVTVSGLNGYSSSNTGTSIQFANVPVGIIQIKVEKAGYATNIQSPTLTSAGSIVDVVLTQPTMKTIQGDAFDTSATPSVEVSGVLVELFHYANNIKIIDGQTTTDNSGHYSMSVPAGTNYILEGKKTGFDVTSINIANLNADLTQNIDLNVPAGVVTNVEYTFNIREQGTTITIPNAYVQLLNDDPQLNAYVYSNSQGIARTTLAKGTYTIRVNKDTAYQQYVGRITITNTGSFNVEMIPLAKLTISGRVIDFITKSAINGQIISFMGQTYPTTNGYFNFEIVAPSNDATLYVRAPNYLTESRVIGRDQVIGNQGTIELTPTECTTQQNLGALTLFDPVFVNKNINLEWDVEPCSPKTFILERKIGAGNYVAIKEISPNTFSFSDNAGIVGGTTYYYRIKAVYELGVNLIVQPSNEVQITVGPEICFNGDIAFCANGVRNKCLNGVLQPPIQCAAEEICIEKSDTLTECVEPKTCKLCNRPFGVFSQSISGSSLFGGKGSSLNLFDFKSTLSSIFFCENEPTCYSDYSGTIADKYLSCPETILSCYDYVSESACTDNKCLRSQICEWKPSSYSELGVGVCRPENTELRDCKKFNSAKERINQAANKVLLTKEMCLLYGDSCYYSSATDLCLNEDEVSCYDYADKKDCTGSDTSSNTFVEANVVVTWAPRTASQSDANKYVKKLGTNILTPSKDYFELGVCKFTDKCIKDADDNNDVLNPQGSSPQLFFGSSPGVKHDCLLNPQTGKYSSDCVRDISVPETIIIRKDYVNKLEFNYSVVDYDGLNNLRSEGLYTYSSSVQSLTGLYPTIFSNGNKIIGPAISSSGASWNVSFFSEDPSHNLGVIKSFLVVLDNVVPEIQPQITIIPNLENHKVTVTARLILPEYRVSDSPNFPTNDDMISCIKREGSVLKTGLILVTNTFGVNVNSPLNENTYLEDSTVDGTLKEDTSETYADIETGIEPNSGITLKYVWECYDRAGNKVVGQHIFDADADMMISEPNPSSEAVASGVAVPISIKTQYNGNCSYSSNGMIGPWADFDSELKEEKPDGFIHNKVVNVLNNEEHTDYKVRCDFVGLPGTIYGSSADTIKVTVDNKAPHTLSFVDDEQIVLENPQWVGEQGFELRCDDVKQGQGARIFTPIESGCNNVYYCAGVGCTPVKQLGDSFTPTMSASTTIRYYSTDNLGNNESLTNNGPIAQIIKVDLTSPIITLSEPVDSLSENALRMDTKEPTIDLIGEIINDHAGDIAPLKFFGSYYKLTDCANNQILNSTIDINDVDLVAKTVDFSRIIPLDEDQRYCITIFSKDSANNLGQLGPVEVVRDSLGPKLGVANLRRESPITGGTTTDLNVPFGQNLILQIRNLEDSYAGYADLFERVDNVWIEDMFGTIFEVTKSGQIWEGTVQTRYWPVGASYITLFSNDSVNNIASKRINFTIADTVDPKSDVTLENIYGVETGTLTKGSNYVILNASESLKNVSFYFAINNKRYNVSFMARDIDAITWIGTVNISSVITGTALLGGLMTDLNGREGTIFTSIPITVDSYDISIPTPNLLFENNEYKSTSSAIPFTGILPEGNPHGLSYKFLVNGKPSAGSNGVVTGLVNGVNTVQVRVEDKYQNYKVRTYRIVATIEGVAVNSDVTPPVFASTDVQIISSDVKVINNKFTSKSGSVNIKAPFNVNADVSSSYIIGQDAKYYSGPNFNIPLVGRTFSETSNVLRVIFIDAAGNQASQTTEIVKDLQPPNLIRLTFGKIVG